MLYHYVADTGITDSMSTNEDMMRNLKSGIQSQQTAAADSEADWQDVVHTNHTTVSSQVGIFTYCHGYYRPSFYNN